VLVVAGGPATPLLDEDVAAFDDVAVAVAHQVESGWVATVAAVASASVGDLVGGFALAGPTRDPAAA
jgi:hypothetical protein